MKVIVVDDEKAMHLILKRMLSKLPGLEIAGSFLDTQSASEYLQGHEVDLIFVDISMPKESGLAFVERLRASGRQTKIVFITSHKEYALSAFDVYAFDYMVKPVQQERLHQTVLRVMTQMREREVAEPEESAEPAALRVEFNCLGRIEIQSAEGMKSKWKSSKSIELFAYLLAHKGRLVSRARLIEDIFGDKPQKNADIYLNTTVYQLRKLLGTYGLKQIMHTDNNHYALNLGTIEVDFLRFEEGCRLMPVIDGHNLEQAVLLEQMYVGDLFGDHVYTWAWNEIERLSQLYTSFTRRLCSALLERKEPAAASLLLMKLLARNELDEESLMLLMQALAMQKNKEALTRQYINFADTLFEEIRIAPSPEVAVLYARLLSEL